MNKQEVQKAEEEIEILEKDFIFLANHSRQGPKVCIFVPKQYHERLEKLRNPLKITVEEAVLK